MGARRFDDRGTSLAARQPEGEVRAMRADDFDVLATRQLDMEPPY